MDLPPGEEPITDEEILYRRIPVSQNYYDPATKDLSPEAFHPRSFDDTGISVYRKKYTPIEKAAIGRPGKSYYIGELHAGDIRKVGLVVRPSPRPNDSGHAEIPDLTYENRRTNQTLVFERRLAKLASHSVKGPFPPKIEAGD